MEPTKDINDLFREYAGLAGLLAKKHPTIDKEQLFRIGSDYFKAGDEEGLAGEINNLKEKLDPKNYN